MRIQTGRVGFGCELGCLCLNFLMCKMREPPTSLLDGKIKLLEMLIFWWKMQVDHKTS